MFILMRSLPIGKPLRLERRATTLDSGNKRDVKKVELEGHDIDMNHGDLIIIGLLSDDNHMTQTVRATEHSPSGLDDKSNPITRIIVILTPLGSVI